MPALEADQVSNRYQLLMSLLLDFSLYILVSSYYCFFVLFHHSYLWSERVTNMSDTMDKKQDWSHYKLLEKPSSAASGSQPTALWTSQAAQTKAHLLPVGLTALHMAAYWLQRRWKKLSKFTRLVPFLPLNCRRVTDTSIISPAIPFPCMLRFCDALKKKKKGGQRECTGPTDGGLTTKDLLDEGDKS